MDLTFNTTTFELLFYNIQTMDYFVGFLFGYGFKEAFLFLRNLSEHNWDNRFIHGDDWEVIPLSEDDLP